MNQFTRTGITLALIAAVAATALAMINAVTAPRIAAYELQVIQQALTEVSGGYTVGDSTTQTQDESVIEQFTLLDEDEQVAGYILQMLGSGYGGEMTIMASYTADGEVIDARLLANAETPGLGKKAEVPSYMEKFIGTGATEPVPVKKDMLDKSDADSISGSTVTFSGVAKTIAFGSSYVKLLGGE
jgi:electron transport complex protein RnfG